MSTLIGALVALAVLILIVLGLAVRIVRQYEQGVLFRFGKLRGPRDPGLRLIIPFVDNLRVISLRVVTMPIQSQGIITRDNVSLDISAVAYYRVVDAVRSVIAIEDVRSAINQIAQTTLRKVVGQHSLDQTLSETDAINLDIRQILDATTTEWGVEVTLVELKDIQLPDSMKRAMARQAEAEREKRAKIINAEGESLAAAALGAASDTMMAHPLALQLRNLQSLVEIGADKNTTVVFPSPLMSTIEELGSFLSRERAASIRQVQNGAPAPAPAPISARPDPATVELRKPAMNAPAIRTEGLSKSYGHVQALRGLDLAVAPGEVVGYLGPNGSGKTTTIRLLLGLARPNAGRAEIFGLDCQRQAVAAHRRLAYVAGEVSLWPALTGMETLHLLGRVPAAPTPLTATS